MEILGLLDSLESTVLDGFKIPMTKKTLINEEQVLILIDKIRLVAQGGGDFAKKAIDKDRLIKPVVEERNIQHAIESGDTVTEKAKAGEIIQEAYKIAKDIREGADKYADEVLANLELTSSRVIRTVQAGRERLQNNTQGERPESLITDDE